MVGIIMFFAALFMLLIGFPVAFTFGAVSVFFGMLAGVLEALEYGQTIMEGFSIGNDMFSMMPYRIWAIMNNTSSNNTS